MVIGDVKSVQRPADFEAAGHSGRLALSADYVILPRLQPPDLAHRSHLRW